MTEVMRMVDDVPDLPLAEPESRPVSRSNGDPDKARALAALINGNNGNKRHGPSPKVLIVVLAGLVAVGVVVGVIWSAYGDSVTLGWSNGWQLIANNPLWVGLPPLTLALYLLIKTMVTFVNYRRVMKRHTQGRQRDNDPRSPTVLSRRAAACFVGFLIALLIAGFVILQNSEKAKHQYELARAGVWLVRNEDPEGTKARAEIQRQTRDLEAERDKAAAVTEQARHENVRTEAEKRLTISSLTEAREALEQAKDALAQRRTLEADTARMQAEIKQMLVEREQAISEAQRLSEEETSLLANAREENRRTAETLEKLKKENASAPPAKTTVAVQIPRPAEPAKVMAPDPIQTPKVTALVRPEPTVKKVQPVSEPAVPVKNTSRCMPPQCVEIPVTRPKQ